MRTAVINGFRTPFCKEGSSLKDVSPDILGALAVREMVRRMDIWNIPPAVIDFVVGSNVATPANAPNIARVAAVKGGLPESIPADTINKNCGSGIAAVNYGRLLIESRYADTVLVVGVESMSRIPLIYSEAVKDNFYSLQRARKISQKLTIGARLYSKLFRFWVKEYSPRIGLLMGLTDPICDLMMGLTAEKLAKDPSLGITREDQDSFALLSHQKAEKAQNEGLFKEEIAPLFVSTAKECLFIENDNGFKNGTSIKLLQKSKPYFDKRYGTVTPGNSSQITDGAACILLMSEYKAESLGLPILGYIGEYSDVGFDPTRMGLSPVAAIGKAMSKANKSLKDFSIVEINEAFAAQVLACTRVMASDSLMRKWFSSYGFNGAFGEFGDNQLNPRGGAIALGHPVGVSGMRLIVSALRELKKRNDELALVSACIGGGQGNAMILKGGK